MSLFSVICIKSLVGDNFVVSGRKQLKWGIIWLKSVSYFIHNDCFLPSSFNAKYVNVLGCEASDGMVWYGMILATCVCLISISMLDSFGLFMWKFL